MQDYSKVLNHIKKARNIVATKLLDDAGLVDVIEELARATYHLEELQRQQDKEADLMGEQAIKDCFRNHVCANDPDAGCKICEEYFRSMGMNIFAEYSKPRSER